nr:transposase [Danio rerio]
MLGEAAASKIDSVPLSDNTISRRISDIAQDVKEQALDSVRHSPFFALQIDESTDVASCAQLLTYVRYVKNMDIHEEFLFSSPLPTHTTGEQIFNQLNEFVRKKDVEWERCCGICSDGAKSMTGRHSGLISRVKEVAPNAIWTHCTIHRQALAAKKMPNDLRSVLDEAVKIINLIKAQPLNARLFHILCDELGAHYKQLLLHTEVRWLSRGRVLSRLFDLREEVFLSNVQSTLVQHMSDLSWIARLAYLSDIFERLNALNLSLQGRDCNVFSAFEQVSSFRRKLDLWATRVGKGCLDMFPTLADFMQEAGSVVHIQPLVAEHLRGLCQQFTHYFSNETIQDEWIRNPFKFKPAESDVLSIQDEEALIDLTSNHELQQMITHSSIEHFWLSVQNEFPELTQKALRKLLPFVSTYLCEPEFSALTFIKNKYRSRLQVEDDLRLFLTSLQPRISLLCAARKQLHTTH